MQSSTMMLQNPKAGVSVVSEAQVAPNYLESEQQFVRLLELEDLDQRVQAEPGLVQDFERVLAIALDAAYVNEQPEAEAAHRFVQRVLYRINRLKFFWYDDLRHYINERSFYLQQIRNRIESVWQVWEGQQLDVAALRQLDLSAVKQALIERSDADLDPPLNASSRYLREEATLAGYRRLLAIASFDGLVEASRLVRILGGASNEVHCTLVRVLLEEYGNGRLNRKHSTFFANMMAELGLSTEPEAYFDLVPWEVLASINHNFLLTECKQHYLRYNGGLAYFEIAGPWIYRNYMTAAQRLTLSDTASGYWELHIREDERHGRWMIDDVALPLADRYPNEAWQIVLGYDQEKLIGDRAGDAMVRSVREADTAATLD
ncbi:iron-containing redox enzyme family protein [Trichocoleus sp. FACHB-591]|uniref:iron-containing redox enzyme family protein n=1 Tax=Trichocoleus sp. FACHB-591 TaxID=2692872 RepID=UPI001685D946|nr:iron-containing redox enzyme family protein [Trichocoleus sp. FACHB-591]MBD2094575.1 iron-containing redox enzyme family protein [Trichocoleus sp. FACHB-591]